MSSPPITPPVEAPKTEAQSRFDDTGAACEWCELYRPGGYHPVHLGDSLRDGQYKVIRKLGDGGFSTVWLAIDGHNKRYVALKVVMSKPTASINKELAIREQLEEVAAAGAFSKNIIKLLDNFEIVGPNGTHQCLVNEPMGATVTSMVAEIEENKALRVMYMLRYPKWMVKSILKQTLSGLAFLHEHGIVHSDIQQGNLLFSIPSLDEMDEERLKQNEAETTEPLRRLDGKQDKWAPKYLALGQPLHEYVNISPDFRIKISDLASAFPLSDPPVLTITPLALRAPELIFNESFDASIDVWAVGCLIYEFLTGMPLFSVNCMGDDDKDDADDGHLMDLNDILEPLPDAWLKKWPRADKWFGPDRERLDPQGAETGNYVENVGSHNPSQWIAGEEDIGGESEMGDFEGRDSTFADEFEGEFLEDPFKQEPFVIGPLETLFEKYKPKDMDSDEAKVVTDLIRQILQYEPAKRPTAAQLLEHPWFNE